MRRRGRLDGNHVAIVEALRGVGASVQSIADIGSGCPDLLVGFRGQNILLEVKDGEAPPSKQKLTSDEKEWHREWLGCVFTVRSVQEALETIEICYRL